MSHYTHFNLSTVTQITMQQTMRTLAFIAETCVFAYLGLALFSFRHRFEPALVIWSLVLCLIGRACNIYPLAVLCNKFREHQITKPMMFIMWFSGKCSAISIIISDEDVKGDLPPLSPQISENSSPHLKTKNHYRPFIYF